MIALTSKEKRAKNKNKLSSRKYKILKMVALNYSNKEIAKRLYLSESTVKSEVSNMMREFNAYGRVHLAILAYKENLIEI